MSLLPVLFTLPWVGVVLFAFFRVRLAPELPAGRPEEPVPSVSVIVPARNEARDIERVLRSLAASDYPDFEILVVDDRSDDGTGELARRVPPGNARRFEVVDGAPLPDGWLGKPWACWQGQERATGEVLLFTDADTVHGPGLLGRAVREIENSGAGALTLAGRQLMESFWERLVQPQIFMLMVLRYPDLARPFTSDRWRDAIANGQYMLFRRETYDSVGGHRRVKSEVVEDLRMAHHLVRDGHRLVLRRAERSFATRMYRSLDEVVAGWSKNMVLGGLHTLPPWIRPLAPYLTMGVGGGLWLLPPVLLTAAVLGQGGSVLLIWAASVVGLSVVFWCAVTARFRAPWYFGLLYPVGAAVTGYIFTRSWRRMGEVEWKGRTYRAELPTEE